MTIAIISHKDCQQHEMGEFHPEQPARLASILQALERSSLQPACKYYQATEVTQETLIATHHSNYLQTLYDVAPKQGRYAFDADTQMNQHTLHAALLAAGSVVQATDLILSGHHNIAFCCVRPPGHHAEYQQAMGFCFINNITNAALYALSQPSIRSVAIIDFDVHHGNGTEDICRRHPNILFFSSFQANIFPGTSLSSNVDHIIKAPMFAGDGSAQFREVIQVKLLAKLEQQQPDLIYISAGFDAHRADPLADINLVEDDYYWISQSIAEIAQTVCNGKIISVLEGGYELNALANSTLAHLEGLSAV